MGSSAVTPAKKLLYFVTEDWYFCSHRLELAKAARRQGYEVAVVTRVNQHGREITDAGIGLIPLDLSRRSLNPLKEIRVIFRLVGIYRRFAPDIVHHVAMKPVLYGTIAARLAGVGRVINALAGLGFLYSSRSFKARFLRFGVRRLMGGLFRGEGVRVIVQNPDDRQLLVAQGIVRKKQLALIRGSGVDTEQFSESPEPEGRPVVMLASRLLWDKGVGEFVRAAKQLVLEGIEARFVLVGDPDPENPASISLSRLAAWREEGVLEWWGRKTGMAEVLAAAHIVVLPSYREGLPKVLLEAAAVGRPIVTTDVPGCREVVRHGENGYLVPKGQAEPLARAIKELLNSQPLRRRMGEKGRERVLRAFSLQQVITETLALYKEGHGR